MKRYFIVFYRAYAGGKMIGEGYTDIVKDDGSYVREKMASLLAVQQVRKVKEEVTSVYINNIIELSEPDYNDWVR